MKIEYWENSSDKSPVKEYIQNIIDNKAKNKIRWVIQDLLVEFGIGIIKTKHGKKLKGYSLYELIIPYNGIYHRIIFCVISDTAWLLHAFGKKSNHTPKKEIKITLNRQNFLNNH